MAVALNTRRRTTTDDAESRVVATIDDLQRIAEEGRVGVLSQDFFSKARRFYNFEVPGERRIPYHPLVRVADLQMLNLREAQELTTPQPRFFIAGMSGRDKEREEAFNASWVHGRFKMQWLNACVYAGIVGTGVLQVHYDKEADYGTGATKLFARDPETYFPDPGARTDDERNYVILEDQLTVEEIASLHGREAAHLLSLESEVTATGRIPRSFIDFPAGGLSLPPGPMRSLGPLGHGGINASRETRAGRIRRRTLFIKDSQMIPFTDHLGLTLTQEAMDAQQRGEAVVIPTPDHVPKFPYGRMVIEAQRHILYDGPNPYPGFPVFRLLAFPALYSYWGPPPIRYTQDLQMLAEEMFSQVYENAYRMNNVSMFINRMSGLTPNDVDGLPGRVYFVDAATGAEQSAKIIAPPEFPQHFLEYPKFLLEMQRELQGFTPARQGQSGGGNVGMGLFDAEVYQAQALTRLRSAMLADSMQTVGEFVFKTMMMVQGDRMFPVPLGGDLHTPIWHYDPMTAEMNYQAILDANSLKIDSATSLKQLALTLARFGRIDDSTLLDWLEVPDKDAILERQQVQAFMQALRQQGGPKGPRTK